MPRSSDPFAAIVADAERVATNSRASAGERESALRAIRQSTVSVLGRIDSMMGDQGYVREAQAAAQGEAVRRLRESAEVAAELVRRGMTTREALVDAGVLFPADLDAMEEEGLLEAAASQLLEAGLLDPAPGAGASVDTFLDRLREASHRAEERETAEFVARQEAEDARRAQDDAAAAAAEVERVKSERGAALREAALAAGVDPEAEWKAWAPKESEGLLDEWAVSVGDVILTAVRFEDGVLESAIDWSPVVKSEVDGGDEGSRGSADEAGAGDDDA